MVLLFEVRVSISLAFTLSNGCRVEGGGWALEGVHGGVGEMTRSRLDHLRWAIGSSTGGR